MAHVGVPNIAAFIVAFAGSVAFWWLYFDRSARASADVIATSDDPGALASAAYHLIHPVMIAGIIVAAAGDEKILSAPSARASVASAWLILGGPALFVAGHAAFKYVIWRRVSWNRLAAIAVLAAIALAAGVLSEVALAACAAAVVAAAAATDRRADPDLSEPAG
jgi:low temperature requirement protein LtrA